MAITAFPALPLFEQTPTAVEELTLARDVLEHATLSRCRSRMTLPPSNFNQLRPLLRLSIFSVPEVALLTGLNLLRLLVQNRIAEFHTELELIPRRRTTIGTSPFASTGVVPMEGAYNRAAPRAIDPDSRLRALHDHAQRDGAGRDRGVRGARVQTPGRRMQRSSSTWTPRDGCAREGAGVARVPTAGRSCFGRRRRRRAGDIPSVRLINQTLLYAKELERIV